MAHQCVYTDTIEREYRIVEAINQDGKYHYLVRCYEVCNGKDVKFHDLGWCHAGMMSDGRLYFCSERGEE